MVRCVETLSWCKGRREEGGGKRGKRRKEEEEGTNEKEMKKEERRRLRTGNEGGWIINSLVSQDYLVS